jgi:hypothetical protein
MKKSVFLHPVLKRMIMSQRLQSIFFFFSSLLLALLFFLPFASFYGDFHTFDLFGYGITSPDNWENGASPFSMTFSLPILVLTVTAMVLCGYLAMGLFRAIKLSQFQKLHKIARIAIIVIVACIAALLGYSYFIIPKIAQSVDITIADPAFRAGAVFPIIALVLTILASSALKKDISKVRATDRIR